MYTQFFRLNQAPFSIAPDPRYLFMSERHREALAHLLYGVNSGGGFVLLTGEIGAGKTTVCRCFLEQIPANCNVAYIFNPKLTVNDLLKSICDEFHIEVRHPGSDAVTVKNYVDALNAYLLAAHAEGQNNVLIIDEAQNLSADVLEQLRLLTNLETNERKLLQIILIGQPELRRILARPELEQLAQRVIARYHLDSLSEQETARYILHRLSIAGLTGTPPFRQKAMHRIHRLTQGVPRRINLLCDRALLGAYVEGKQEVDSRIIKKAAAEVFDDSRTAIAGNSSGWRYATLSLAAVAFIVGVMAWTMNSGFPIKDGISEKAASNAVIPGKPIDASSKPALASSSGVSPRDAAQAAAAIPVLSDLGTFFNHASSDAAAAYRELAQLWGVSLPNGEPCQVAKGKELHCYKSSGGLAEIRQLDRPAILSLRDDTNKIHYALLTGLTNASATLRFGGAAHNVSLVALGRRFRTDFVTFWRAPQNFRETIRDGDHGADVDWLALQLSKLNGSKEPVPNRPVDQALIKQVREFQFAHGLEVDGIAGPKTLMHLNSAAGVTEPRLQSGVAVANLPSGK